MSNAQMGWLAMIGYRHVWTGPIIVHVHSHIHIYVGPAGGRILSVYPRRPLRGQRLPPARLLRRPRGHHPKKMVPEPGRRSKPERVWGLEILIFGASRQPGKPGHIGILFMLCADWACEVRCCPPWLERMWPTPVATAEDPARDYLEWTLRGEWSRSQVQVCLDEMGRALGGNSRKPTTCLWTWAWTNLGHGPPLACKGLRIHAGGFLKA